MLDDNLIKSIEATGEILDLDEAVIEKDYYVSQVIHTLSDVESDYFRLVFAGGTCLSKAHKIVKRMSEDVDFKIQIKSAQGFSKTKLLKELKEFRSHIQSRLELSGLNIGEPKVRNEGKYLYIEVNYPIIFPSINNRKEGLILIINFYIVRKHKLLLFSRIERNKCMSTEMKNVKESIQETQNNSNQSVALVPNRWKGKSGTHHNDMLTLHQALHNAAVNLDIKGVEELIKAGADPNLAVCGLPWAGNPPMPSFKAMIKEESEDYPDFPMERYHYNAVLEVISYEFFDFTKGGGTIVPGAKDKEKEAILILLLKGGAIPSRCVGSKPLKFNTILSVSGPYDHLSKIILEEIRHIAEAIYFAKSFDAGIQNLLLYKHCAEKASSFHTDFGINAQITNGQSYLRDYGFAQHVVAMTRNSGNIFTKWEEEVLHPIQKRMENAVADDMFEPYSSIKSVLSQKFQFPTTILCMVMDYLDTSLNVRFHNAFTQMHMLRFNALEETPSKSLTISWNKFHKTSLKDLSGDRLEQNLKLEKPKPNYDNFKNG